MSLWGIKAVKLQSSKSSVQQDNFFLKICFESYAICGLTKFYTVVMKCSTASAFQVYNIQIISLLRCRLNFLFSWSTNDQWVYSKWCSYFSREVYFSLDKTIIWLYRNNFIIFILFLVLEGALFFQFSNQ